MSNPIDDFLELEKEAGFMDIIRGAAKGFSGAAKPVLGAAQESLPGVARAAGEVAPKAFAGMERGYELGQKAQVPSMFAGMGVAATGIGMTAKRITQAIDKRRDFKQMMELDPRLHEVRGKDVNFFNAAYSSLRDVNPTLGQDPLTAGAMMHKMLDNPENAGLILSGSVKTPEAPKPSGLGLEVGVPMGPAILSRRF